VINAHVVTLDKITKVSRQSREATAPRSQTLAQGSPSTSGVGCSSSPPSQSRDAHFMLGSFLAYHWCIACTK